MKKECLTAPNYSKWESLTNSVEKEEVFFLQGKELFGGEVWWCDLQPLS
jgi:hypothetical protein